MAQFFRVTSGIHEAPIAQRPKLAETKREMGTELAVPSWQFSCGLTFECRGDEFRSSSLRSDQEDLDSGESSTGRVFEIRDNP